jgi:DNA-binding protein YbaB
MELFKAVKEAMSAKSKLGAMEKALKAKIIDITLKGVDVKVNAKNEFLSLNISDDLLKENKEKLEKTVLEAVQTATKKAQEVMAEESKKIMGSLNIPGLS